jgi:glucosylglycerol-phosphate synthase
MVLATDLDGTFLGGSESERAELYQLVIDYGIKLIYVTGRGLETVEPLLLNPHYPAPDFVVGDVGATVVDGRSRQAIQPLQEEIGSLWPGTFDVLKAFEDFPSLVRQRVPQERRCSFILSDLKILPDLEGRSAELGCELVFSALKYIDILPRGVSKGSTLKRLIDLKKLSQLPILVAGDTLNDLSMYSQGYQGVVVGNADQDLQQATAKIKNVFPAVREGAGGILEAIRHFDLIKTKSAAKRIRFQSAKKSERSSLIVAYHRLPFEERKEKGRLVLKPPKSPNGIIPTLLGLFREGRPGMWVAWCQRESRGVQESLSLPAGTEDLKSLQLSPVALTKKDVDLFYKIFSKEALWPIIFSFPERAVFREEHWEHFCEINQIFAQKVAQEAEEGATVWIHDYNLWMVPATLRALRPDLNICFFHHTAFPSADIFCILPWRRQIIGSLLQCDYVGFHIPAYADNFAQVVRSHVSTEVIKKELSAPRFATYGCALGVDSYPSVLQIEGSQLHIGVHPVGVDADFITRSVQRPESKRRVDEIRNQFSDQKMILSVERLDYVKGPLEKLHAYEKFLEMNPDWHARVSLVNICTPPAPEMLVYHEVRQQVDEIVGRINGRFGSISWTPVVHLYRSVSFDDLLCYYAAADVAWVTPLRDGLNLVAKEFVVAQSAIHGDGVLILSEFAGAAVELFGSLWVNPYDPKNMQDMLERALKLSPIERKSRLKRMAAIVKAHTMREWSDEFLGEAEKSRAKSLQAS